MNDELSNLRLFYIDISFVAQFIVTLWFIAAAERCDNL